MRVLIVDDQIFNVVILQEILEELLFIEYDGATNGQEAI